MLAEDRSLEPFGSTTPRKLSTIGRDVKVENYVVDNVNFTHAHYMAYYCVSHEGFVSGKT